MLRLAVCDDMPQFLVETVEMLQKWNNKPGDLVTELFTDGDSLIESHSVNPYDIILLDVVMPLINGIDTAAEIRKADKQVKIVFLTTSKEFAIDAFSVHASNYLLKPIDENKMFKCLDELVSDIKEKAKTINIKGTSIMHHVAVRDIEYLEAQGKKVILALSDGKIIESINPLYHFEDLLLGDGFYKCHRSYMVNMYRIASFTPGNNSEVRMNSGARIPIAGSCKSDFEKSYFEIFFEDSRGEVKHR